MKTTICMITIGLLLLLPAGVCFSEQGAQPQAKGLDEQVQEIKSDVLAIAAELDQLEEKLLFPSQTQCSIFVSLAPAEAFRLDAIDISLDARPVAAHIYSFKELEALQKGGVQRIFTGNISSGDHRLQVLFRGQDESGSKLERRQDFTISKGVGPAFYELVLSHQGLTLKDR